MTTDLAAIDAEFGFRGRPFDYTTAEVVCIVIAFKDGRRIVACPRLGKSWALLEPYLSNPGILFVAHHGSHAERKVLELVGLPLPVKQFLDTELMERVLHIVNEGDLRRRGSKSVPGPYELLSCLKRRSVQVRDSQKKAELQKKIGALKFGEGDLGTICEYCGDDCADTIKLAQLQFEEFRHLPSAQMELLAGLLQPHALRLAEVEAKGLLFDMDSYQFVRGNGERLLLGMQAKLNSLGFAGTFNHAREKLTVATQNRNVMGTFRSLGLNHLLDSLPAYKADATKPENEKRRSLEGVFKEGHKSPVPFIRTAKDYHDLIALLERDWTAFVDSDGRIRPSAIFPGTSSYRAQQTMPHPLMLPYFARPLFHAKPGHVLFEIDYKCQEVGLAADFFGDGKLRSIFNRFELDLYSEVGSEMGLYPRTPGGPADPAADPERRSMLKTALLAIQYGGGIKALQSQLNIPREKARAILASYWHTFDELRRGRDSYLRLVRERKHAWNTIGLTRAYKPFTRRLGIAEDSSLSYLNFPIQSAGAAILMEVLRRLPVWVNPVLTMHDAILVEIPIDAVADARIAAEAAMASAATAAFPRLRCRTEARAAFRYHKDRPDSLHNFFIEFGVDLPTPVGWCGPEGS